MTTFVVASGVTETNGQTLANNETGTIASGGTLAVGAVDAITWTGGSATPGVVITNAGTISSSTERGIDTSGSFTTGSITLQNVSGARLIASASDGFRINTSITTGTITVENSGILVAGSVDGSNNVVANAGSGQGLDFVALQSTATVHITNNASGLIGASGNDALRPGSNATIDNYGRIVGAGTDPTDNPDGIDFQDLNTGGVVNNHAGGSITGARHGITGDNPITVTNAGEITGQMGAGINMDTLDPLMTTVIDNAATGTITGNANLANDADGDAIDIDHLIDLDNHGLIRTFGTSVSSLTEALAIGGGVVNNFADGTITSVERAITVDDSNLGDALAAITVSNEGLIEGGNGQAILIIGTFADTITNRGTITGSVVTGGGNDSLNLYGGSSISGLIDGQAGTDALYLQGTGSGTVASFANVEAVNLLSGTWTLGSDGASSITFAGGGETLHLAASTVGDGSYAGTFFGFGATDAIALDGIGSATAATLGVGNLLTITGAPGGAITLQLDPATDYSGLAFVVEPAGTGSIVTVATAPPPSSAPTAGNDDIPGTEGADTTAALAGADVVNGLGGNDALFGNQGNDTVNAGSGNDTVYGGVDNDLVDGSDGNDLLFGNEGQDTVAGGDGANTIVGGQDSADGADSISAGAGADLIWGNGGADTLAADGGANTVIGGFGSDSIATGSGGDIVFGNEDNDTLDVGDGTNLVFGGLGNDSILAGTGNDTIWGNEGSDTMAGGAGADRYEFAAGSGGDQVNGFSFADGDRLSLQGQTFTTSTSGDGDVVLTLSGGGTIELNGIAPGSFSPGFVV
jgi:Ca2+-binding RTX toxin-like protein